MAKRAAHKALKEEMARVAAMAAAQQRANQQAWARRLGQRLRWAREYANGSSIQLAAAWGVDSSLIRHIELGNRVPSLHLLLTLCEVLSVTPHYLLYGEVENIPAATRDTLVTLHPELRFPQKPHGLGKRGPPNLGSAPFRVLEDG